LGVIITTASANLYEEEKPR